jgi:hypothetical protein
MNYQVGDTVRRMEDREQTLAVVLGVENLGSWQLLHLGYTEGGTGWWPESAVEPEVAPGP